MLTPLATALVLSFSAPSSASTTHPILLAQNTATEGHPSQAEAQAPAASHGHASSEPSRARGEASGQNPTGAPNPPTPWSGVGADGVSGTNQR